MSARQVRGSRVARAGLEQQNPAARGAKAGGQHTAPPIRYTAAPRWWYGSRAKPCCDHRRLRLLRSGSGFCGRDGGRAGVERRCRWGRPLMVNRVGQVMRGAAVDSSNRRRSTPVVVKGVLAVHHHHRRSPPCRYRIGRPGRPRGSTTSSRAPSADDLRRFWRTPPGWCAPPRRSIRPARDPVSAPVAWDVARRRVPGLVQSSGSPHGHHARFGCRVKLARPGVATARS